MFFSASLKMSLSEICHLNFSLQSSNKKTQLHSFFFVFAVVKMNKRTIDH